MLNVASDLPGHADFITYIGEAMSVSQIRKYTHDDFLAAVVAFGEPRRAGAGAVGVGVGTAAPAGEAVSNVASVDRRFIHAD
jgi:hypothetical protein